MLAWPSFGVKFLYQMAGTSSQMHGTGFAPALRMLDVDVNTGEVSGLL